MVRYSICGAASYACGELLRLMVGHPETELVHLAGGSTAGEMIQNAHPALHGFYNQKIIPMSDENVDMMIRESDVIFSALEAGATCAVADQTVKAGKKFIDFGADLRFRDHTVYETWYKLPHAYPQLTRDAVYAIPEIWREQIKGASLIANPGCYPTATTLGLYPALKAGLIQKDSIIVDAKSGTSGAGKRPSADKIFAEVSESFKAYGVASHRHTPEIEQSIESITGETQVISFQPHLVPMVRGIHATIYATLKEPITNDALYALYQEAYKDEYFVHVHPAGQWPATKWASGSNLCHMAAAYDPRTKRLIVCSVIDNIGKGAAGQAVQNMNLAFGLEETTGLRTPPMYP